MARPLKICLENFRDQNMVFFCKEVCGNFSYMKIGEYFFPQHGKLRRYTHFLKRELAAMQRETEATEEVFKEPERLTGITVF